MRRSLRNDYRVDNVDEIKVFFVNISVKDLLEELKKGSSEDCELARRIDLAIDAIKLDYEVGIKIPRRLWPKDYFLEIEIRSLWKYNLDGNWRLIYNVQKNTAEIACIVLEWLRHKDYERKFNYHRT